MISKGSRTDSEGGACTNKSKTGCANSREPDGADGYKMYCCQECRDGQGLDRPPVENDGGDGSAEMDAFAKMFPTLG